MNAVFQYGTFAAGLGLFLFAMSELEAGLTQLVGGSLRRLVRRTTSTPLLGILSGVVGTAVLQSSSVVLLMVMAFVGAGVLTPVHALGVVLGANLGTTLTGWIVATVGFEVDLVRWSLPVVGVSAVALVFLPAGSRAREVGRTFFAFGLLLLGLSYMKESIESLDSVLDVGRLAGYPVIVYALVGAVFAALIHSSSAVVMIALSALAGGLTTLESSAALVVGADLGTTSTALLGAVGGIPGKKRVALAHFLVNLATAALALPLIGPLLRLLQEMGVTNALYSLVAFHSTFNALGILLFIPFLGPFSRFLESRFKEAPRGVAQFIDKVPSNVPDSALEAIGLETSHLLSRVMRENLVRFESEDGFVPPSRIGSVGRPFPGVRTARDEYAAVKQLEGEILAYAIEIQRQPLSAEAAGRLKTELDAARHALQSAKSIKDVRHNLSAYLRDEADRAERVRELGRSLAAMYAELAWLWQVGAENERFEKLASLLAQNQERHREGLQAVHRQLAEDRLDPREVSTALNINREVYSSTKALIEAVGSHLMPDGAVQHLEAVATMGES